MSSKPTYTGKNSDPVALDEGASSFARQWAMGIINDEKAFLSCCSSIDALMGRSGGPTRTDAIVKDRYRDSYFEVIIASCRQTKLTVSELSRLLVTMEELLLKKGNDKHSSFKDFAMLVDSIVKWARFVDFEPEWHMRMRGDTRPLPSRRDPNRDMWGYLKRLYTDPEAARLRQPDGISAMAKMYPGYDECVRRARREGQDELKRMYGPDVDLSLVTDKKKPEDPKMSSFLGSIRDGSLGELLGAR